MSSQVENHWSNYAEYSKTLRAWLVAYGVGGPVLLATNDSFAEKVVRSGHAQMVIGWFLLGVALQVVLAFLNKNCAYQEYLAAELPKHAKTRSYRFWHWINELWAIDIVMDAASIAAFAAATVAVLTAVIGV